jgi:DNA-damage-inducible protein D
LICKIIRVNRIFIWALLKIKQISEPGNEFWSASDLQKPLGYEKWENFSKVIDRAMLACDTAGLEA